MSSYSSRRSTRLRDYDYSQAGAYFVTLCIEHRLPLLGRIREDTMVLSPAGEMVAAVWGNLGTYYAGVSIDAFVVMPNHFHGIIVLSGDAGEDRDGATVPTPSVMSPVSSSVSPAAPPSMPTSLSLSTVMQRFKTFTAHEYGKGVATHDWPRYPSRLWQHRFHEHVIRNERARCHPGVYRHQPNAMAAR